MTVTVTTSRVNINNNAGPATEVLLAPHIETVSFSIEAPTIWYATQRMLICARTSTHLFRPPEFGIPPQYQLRIGGIETRHYAGSGESTTVLGVGLNATINRILFLKSQLACRNKENGTLNSRLDSPGLAIN
jgi:hypothetical protein